MSALDDYLDLLSGFGRGRGWVEIRYRDGDRMRSRFYRPTRRSAIARLVDRRAPEVDVFAGCALRSRQQGSRAAVGEVWTVWAELDHVDAVQRLKAFTIPPAMIVASGTRGHAHAYWALLNPTDADSAEAINRRLALALEADSACVDPARILRPPGTLNHKGEQPTSVHRVHAVGSHPLELALLDQMLPPLSMDMVVRDDGPRVVDDDLLDIPPSFYATRLTGRQLGRDHKMSCPFHDDTTPSLHVYPTADRGWFCFGCGRGGSIYDFAAELWELDTRGPEFIELRQRLTKALG